MTDKQKLKHLKQAVSNFNKGWSYDFKPFLRTYTITPVGHDNATYDVYDSDCILISKYNSLTQIMGFIFTGGDFEKLNP